MSLISTATSRILKVRSMDARDLPRLLQIERQPSSHRWTRKDFMMDLQSSDRGIWVATIQNYVVGFLVYRDVSEVEEEQDEPVRSRASARQQTAAERLPLQIEILHVSVAADWHRRGVGLALVQRFDSALRHPEDCIQAAVPETSLAAQLLLRSAGYKAVRVLRGHFDDEDAYLMERRRV
jgi:ribosomal protein S18 acetylase RimI-like enzyme